MARVNEAPPTRVPDAEPFWWLRDHVFRWRLRLRHSKPKSVENNRQGMQKRLQLLKKEEYKKTKQINEQNQTHAPGFKPFRGIRQRLGLSHSERKFVAKLSKTGGRGSILRSDGFLMCSFK